MTDLIQRLEAPTALWASVLLFSALGYCVLRIALRVAAAFSALQPIHERMQSETESLATSMRALTETLGRIESKTEALASEVRQLTARMEAFEEESEDLESRVEEIESEAELS